MSPAFMTIVSGIGVASTNVPFGDSTWRPPAESWNNNVIEPAGALTSANLFTPYF
jgi:hypothetical protein